MATAVKISILAAIVLGAALGGTPKEVQRHGPKPAWRLGDAKGKLENFGKQMSHSDYMKPKLQAPPHIQKRAQAAIEKLMPTKVEKSLVTRGQCGAHIKIKDMHIKEKKQAGLLAMAEHPGADSFSLPGAGGTQTLKDEGRSTSGKVFPANGGKPVEPFVEVLKDGFFEVGCFTDAMLVSGDKYSFQKDEYGANAQYAGVSIVHYSEMVLDEKASAMTPIVCFEFCRTLPNMVYFGINNGDQCYCTPYYKPYTSDNSQCDVPCAGDSTKMCGNTKKSSIFEMHLCADTQGRLKETMVAAKEALDFYFESVVMASTLGSQMTRSGKALEKIAGIKGSPEGASNAQRAMQMGGGLTQGYRSSFKTYNALLAAYTDATSLKDANFGESANMNMAELAMRNMKAGTTPVLQAAKVVHDAAKAAYPLLDEDTFGEDPDAYADENKASNLAKGDSGLNFRPASYLWDTKYTSDDSSCDGIPVGTPLVGLGLQECAKVCEKTVYPDMCFGFAFYSIHEDKKVDGKGLSDLCFMLNDFKTVQTFKCPASLAQKSNSTTGLRGTAASKSGDAAQAEAQCMVKMSMAATGYAGKGKWKKAERCFSEGEAEVPAAYQHFKMPDIEKMELDGKDTIAAPP